ncbi:MAG: GNAT family N-acetyltransferase [Longimicrobiales bacterium]|nr:GNAT family N-acetyltransferase [Longimicrobiales bacterium]
MDALAHVARPPRRVKASDLDELVRMRRALWSDSTRAEAEEALQKHLRGDLFILVAERDGYAGLAAFAEAGIRTHAEGCAASPVAYLEGIWVDEDARRVGIAQALVEEVVAWAHRRGLRELASDSEVGNHGARSFHEALGFEDAGTIVAWRRTL